MVIVALLLVVAGCATQPMPVDFAPGFLFGLLHGLFAPFAIVISLFNSEVRIYAFPNAGVRYDIGFLLGLALLGGGATARVSRDGHEEEDSEDDEDEVERLRGKVRRLRRRLRRYERGA